MVVATGGEVWQRAGEITASVGAAVSADDRSLYRHSPQTAAPGYGGGKADKPLAKARFL
jgi:hypothetical protein